MEKIKRITGIPPKLEAVELFVLRYPADPSRIEKDRLLLERIVYYEKWKI